MFLKFAFEALEERERIRSRARKTGDDLVIVKAAGFPSGVLQDMIAQGDLAIGDQDDFVLFAYAEHGSAVQLRLSG